MSAQRPPRRVKRISFLQMPLTLREQDRKALEWLANAAASGNPPIGAIWPITGQRWDVIWQRFNANDYERDTRRSLWMNRHFHVRRAYCDETPAESAAHIAELWNGSKKQAETVRTAASRRNVKDQAKRWIEEAKKQYQRPMPGICAPAPPADAIVYELIDLNLAAIAEGFRQKK